MRLSGTKATAIHQYRGLGNQLWDLAGNRPSLDLRFAESKSLVDATTGTNLIDFTRASSGTYVGSDGLIKTATTNLLLRSEEFDTTWGLSNINTFGSGSVANATQAPDGTLTADLVTETLDVSNSQHNIGQAVTVSSGVVYTISVFTKLPVGSTRQLQILVANTNFAATPVAIFNLTSGSVVSSSNSTASVVPYPNGWYRLILTTIPATSSGLNGFNFRFYDASSNSNSYIGDGTSGIYIWGAQLEQSSTVGEYIPTTSTINSAPRFDHDPTTGESLGLLVEESRTNSIRNNTMVGAVAGTPGTLPTNWAATTPANGITREILGTGTEDGIAYIDCRFSGTNTLGSNFYMDITFDSGTITAAQNQAWTESVYVKLLSGVISGAAFSSAVGLTLYGLPSFSDNGSSVRPLPATSGRLSAQRFSASRTFQNVGTTGVSPRISWIIATGGTIDFTIRIGLPQLERGAFATSVIPTTDAEATRAADVASISGSNFSSWYRQDAGSARIEWDKRFTGNWTSFASFFVARDSAAPDDNLISYLNSNGINSQVYYASEVNNISQLSYAFYNVSNPGPYTSAAALTTNSAALAQGGAIRGTDSSLAMLTTLNEAVIGPVNSTIRRITFWPTRLPNETLQGITQ